MILIYKNNPIYKDSFQRNELNEIRIRIHAQDISLSHHRRTANSLMFRHHDHDLAYSAT